MDNPDGEHKQDKIRLRSGSMFFVLGLKGLTPFSSVCNSLRLDTNELTGYSEYAKLRTIEFGVCHYFDSTPPTTFYAPEHTKKL